MTIAPTVPSLALSSLPRGNQILQSQTLDNATWVKTSGIAITANATTDVYGLSTMDLATRSATTAQQVSQAVTKPASAVQITTLSFDAKFSIGNFLAVRVYGSSTSNRVDAIFNLSTGALVSYAATGTFVAMGTPTITASGVNSIWNIALTFATDAAATYTVAVSPSTVSQQVDGTGSASSAAVYLGQMQGEPYANQSGYARTTTAADPGIWAGTQSLPVLPYIPGVMPTVVKSPQWSSTVKRALSGRERRQALWNYPLWQFTLEYEVIRHLPTNDELVTMWEFFNTVQGMASAWLFVDPTDCQILSSAPASFGTGDGATTTFQLQRQLNSWSEPVYDVYQPFILDNGALTTSSYTLSPNGQITFGTAPLSGHALTWFGNYYFGCRFLADNLEFSRMMSYLWAGKKLSFVSLRA